MKVLADLKPSAVAGNYDIYIGPIMIFSNYNFAGNIPEEYKPEELSSETSISKILELKKAGFNSSEIIEMKINKMI